MHFHRCHHTKSTDISSDETKTPAPLERSAPDEIVVLYQSYSRQLSATLRSMYGDGPPDPDDITQLAFEKVFQRGDLSSISNLKAFVWSTARNLFRKEKRAQAVRTRHDYEVEQIYFSLKGDDSTPERVIGARQQLKAINKLLWTMPEKRRKALILHRIDGLSVAAVGRRLGISRTAAAKHVARALEEIDALFAEKTEC